MCKSYVRHSERSLGSSILLRSTALSELAIAHRSVLDRRFVQRWKRCRAFGGSRMMVFETRKVRPQRTWHRKHVRLLRQVSILAMNCSAKGRSELLLISLVSTNRKSGLSCFLLVCLERRLSLNAKAVQLAMHCRGGRQSVLALGMYSTCYTLRRQDVKYFGGLREALLTRDGHRCRVCDAQKQGIAGLTSDDPFSKGNQYVAPLRGQGQATTSSGTKISI